MDNGGISAQRTDGDGRSRTMCPGRRNRRSCSPRPEAPCSKQRRSPVGGGSRPHDPRRSDPYRGRARSTSYEGPKQHRIRLSEATISAAIRAFSADQAESLRVIRFQVGMLRYCRLGAGGIRFRCAEQRPQTFQFCLMLTRRRGRGWTVGKLTGLVLTAGVINAHPADGAAGTDTRCRVGSSVPGGAGVVTPIGDGQVWIAGTSGVTPGG
jgi:hypothetical protein